METKFTETQRFTQWWLWVILIGVLLIPIYGMYKQMFLGEPFGDNPTSNIGLIVFFVTILGLVIGFRLIKLHTTVDAKGISFDFLPFSSKEILWSEVLTAEVIDYGCVGGYGVRLFTDYGTVYNIKGRIGLHVVLKSGDEFCLGTQKPDELKMLLNKLTILEV